MNIPDNISPQEWQVRCELAALYRMVAHFRMTDLIDTHISLRVPGPEHHFLINRYGVMFQHMRASDLVKIDHAGKVVDPVYKDHEVNEAGFVIHSAIHMAREDMNCVIHTHTAAGIAVSAQDHGLLPISQHALKFYGKLAYHDYEGVALCLDERERLVNDLGTHRAMILRNHGLLAGGQNVAQAFYEIHFLERACQAQIQALAGGSKLRYPSEQVCKLTASQFTDDDEGMRMIQMAWEAALRLIEDQREDYCS
ncbi:class II aldolase/adducin family protein [Pseudomonas marincola]|uniref:class II aldolase/adducin family protein n=2 Tax=Pseudomonas TaxID=286 RepID=UPI0008543A11|nr:MULTISPECIES: class II aldolase/adducin family protein [Pseudomonas]OEO27125.1 class II aldolase [Pseudomonas sp. J237]SFT64497.1 Ribulose-5-phosphate 4-epimerase/Fuculose-1-phosphate aldolase [Pseudomonas marincola]